VAGTIIKYLQYSSKIAFPKIFPKEKLAQTPTQTIKVNIEVIKPLDLIGKHSIIILGVVAVLNPQYTPRKIRPTKNNQ